MRCTNAHCKRFWNRDVNGSKNIRMKAMRIIYGLEEIPELSRKIIVGGSDGVRHQYPNINPRIENKTGHFKCQTG